MFGVLQGKTLVKPGTSCASDVSVLLIRRNQRLKDKQGHRSRFDRRATVEQSGGSEKASRFPEGSLLTSSSIVPPFPGCITVPPPHLECSLCTAPRPNALQHLPAPRTNYCNCHFFVLSHERKKIETFPS